MKNRNYIIETITCKNGNVPLIATVKMQLLESDGTTSPPITREGLKTVILNAMNGQSGLVSQQTTQAILNNIATVYPKRFVEIEITDGTERYGSDTVPVIDDQSFLGHAYNEAMDKLSNVSLPDIARHTPSKEGLKEKIANAIAKFVINKLLKKQ